MKGLCPLAREVRRAKKLSVRVYFEPPGRRPAAYYYRLLGGGLRLVFYLGDDPNLGLRKLGEMVCCSVNMSRARLFSQGAVYLLLASAIIYSAFTGGVRGGSIGGLLALVGLLGFILSAIEAHYYSRGRMIFGSCISLYSRRGVKLASGRVLAEAVERIASYGLSCRRSGGRGCGAVLVTGLGKFRVVADRHGVRAVRI